MQLEIGRKYTTRSGREIIEPIRILENPALECDRVVCVVTSHDGTQEIAGYRLDGSYGFAEQTPTTLDAVEETK